MVRTNHNKKNVNHFRKTNLSSKRVTTGYAFTHYGPLRHYCGSITDRPYMDFKVWQTSNIIVFSNGLHNEMTTLRTIYHPHLLPHSGHTLHCPLYFISQATEIIMHFNAFQYLQPAMQAQRPRVNPKQPSKSEAIIFQQVEVYSCCYWSVTHTLLSTNTCVQ